MAFRGFVIPSISVVTLLLATALAHGDKDNAADQLATKLVGSWKMVSAKYGGADSPLPRRLLILKHVTPTHTTWMRIEPTSGNVLAMATGTWKLDGDTLIEKPIFGLGNSFETVKGQQHSFKCKIDGDKWYHSGRLANGLTIEEVFERVA